MREKIVKGLRAARVVLALKAAVGGFAAALAAFGVGADFFGLQPNAVAEGTVSVVGATIAALAALRA